MSSNPYAGVRYLSLRGRSVLITGGAGGIGAEMVSAFAAQESRVAFLDIDRERGEPHARATGCRFLACDLTDIAALRAAVLQVESEQGGIDVLVNNAGRDERQNLADIGPEEWRRMLALNVDHQFFASQAVAPGMARRGGGSI
ncbi:MAG: SDR family NAD(P)-dependent oxidoreductase, partial [Steroidobacteraceae bacterium]